MKKTFFHQKLFYNTFITTCLIGSLMSVHSCKKEETTIKKKESIVKTLNKKIKSPVKKKVIDNRRTIYITFDDGPNRGTKNVMEVLKKKKVPTTFFVVGKHVNDSRTQKKMMKEIENDTLIEVANHSYSHANHKYKKFYENKEVVLADFNRTKDTLHLTSNIARTPGRNIWRIPKVKATDIKSSKESADYLEENGYKLVGWDLEWKHGKKMQLEANHKVMIKRVDSIFMNDLEKTSRHLVLLTHDQYIRDETSKKELDLFIDELQKSKRFQFKKISEYPHINDVLR